jgi:hypothetical protein
MVSLAKLLRIRQGIEKKYKNIGLKKNLLSIQNLFDGLDELETVEIGGSIGASIV